MDVTVRALYVRSHYLPLRRRNRYRIVATRTSFCRSSCKDYTSQDICPWGGMNFLVISYRPWSCRLAPTRQTTLCTRQTQSLQRPWRSDHLPRRICVWPLNYFCIAWHCIDLVKFAILAQSISTSVLTVLRGLRRLFSTSCSIVNARLETMTCLIIMLLGCKRICYVLLDWHFLLAGSSEENLRSRASARRWGWQKLARNLVSLSPNRCW